MRKSEKTSTQDGAAPRAFRAKIRWVTRADAAALRSIYAYYVENTTVSFELETPSVAEMERRIAEVEGVYPFLVCVVEEESGRDAEDFSVDACDATAKIVENNKTDGTSETGKANGIGKVDKIGAIGDIGKIDKIGVAGVVKETDGNGVIGKVGVTGGVEKIDKSGESGGVVGERIVGYALAHRAFERAAYSWTAETSVYVDLAWRRRGIGEALYSALIEILEAQGVRTLYAVVVAENEASVEFHRRVGYREFATFKSAGWKFERWLDVVWLERTLGVWRDAEEKNGARQDAPTGKETASKEKTTIEKTVGKTTKGKTVEKRSTNLAPTPPRPLSDFPKERLTEICAAAVAKLAQK